MNENQIQYINPKELKFRNNVRLRGDSDLSELMESIKQQGIQQAICARTEDKTIIYGHRRTAAAIKLNLEKVPVLFRSGIDEKKANILNLLENMQRKDVTSIEIGSQCNEMLKKTEFKLSIDELATLLGVSSNRIKVCLDAFRRLPEEYRKRVVFVTSSRSRKYGQLPENVVYAILNFSRTYRRLSASELKQFLNAAGSEKLTTSQIGLIGKLMGAGMPFKKALNEINLYVIMTTNIPLLKTELASAMRNEKVYTKRDFLAKVFTRLYPNITI